MKRIVLALVLALAACKDPAPTELAARDLRPLPPGQAPWPYSFELTSPDARVALTIDQQAGAWPALHQRLYQEGRRELTDFVERAHVDRQDLAVKERDLPPYTRNVAWTVTAETARLVSLRQAWEDYTGGARGSKGATVLLWSKGDEAPVTQTALFRPDANYAALDRLLCDGALKARRARIGQADAQLLGDCPTWKDRRAVLVPSALENRAGGLMFIFDPYVLGPSVDGTYEVVVPQAAFRAALMPKYQGEFDGAPAVARRRP
jgi:hypothetical protein